MRNAQADERAWFLSEAKESEEVWRVIKSSLGILGRFRKLYSELSQNLYYLFVVKVWRNNLVIYKAVIKPTPTPMAKVSANPLIIPEVK